MDDYKRGLYMQVLRELKFDGKRTILPEKVYLCPYLIDQLVLEEHLILEDEQSDLDYEAVYGKQLEVIKEFFPEFYQLYNGTCWNQFGISESVSDKDAWWQPNWREPRIRALECILRD